MKFSLDDIKNTACASLNEHLFEPVKKKKIVKARNDCKEVQLIHWRLKEWCLEKGYTLEKEYRFSKRRFRFDFFVKELNAGIEYEGIFSKHSRHTNKIGYSKDTEKYSLAATMGIFILRYTAMNYENVLHDLKKIEKSTRN